MSDKPRSRHSFRPGSHLNDPDSAQVNRFGQTVLNGTAEDNLIPEDKMSASIDASSGVVRIQASIFDSPALINYIAKHSDDNEDEAQENNQTEDEKVFAGTVSEFDSVLYDAESNSIFDDEMPETLEDFERLAEGMNSRNSETRANSSLLNFGRTSESKISLGKSEDKISLVKNETRNTLKRIISDTQSCLNSSCGVALPVGANFCPECGMAVKNFAKHCIECGFKYVNQEKFCPECGNARG